MVSHLVVLVIGFVGGFFFSRANGKGTDAGKIGDKVDEVYDEVEEKVKEVKSKVKKK